MWNKLPKHELGHKSILEGVGKIPHYAIRGTASRKEFSNARESVDSQEFNPVVQRDGYNQTNGKNELSVLRLEKQSKNFFTNS